MLPVRCFTCGKVLANKEETFNKLKKEGKINKEIFEYLKLDRYCCRRMLLTSIDTCLIMNTFEIDKNLCDNQYKNIY
jgi:DNA-directed RNA polymerase subunit N (RpoN/RPB10)